MTKKLAKLLCLECSICKIFFNWIFCRSGKDNFKEAINFIRSTIHTDYKWVKFHTKLQNKALEWDRKQYRSSLLHGKDLQEAELQFATNASKEPRPTDLQYKYVFASRKAADSQRRIIAMISIAGALVFAALALFGFAEARIATENGNEAIKHFMTAEAASTLAHNSEVTAIANANAAALSQAEAIRNENIASTAQANAETWLRRVLETSGYRAEALASISQELGDHTSPEAVLLALEAYQTASIPQTTSRMLELLKQELIIDMLKSNKGVFVLAFNPQDDELAIGHTNTSDIDLWEFSSQAKETATLRGHTQSVYGLAFSPDGKTLATGSLDSQIILWNVKTGLEIGENLKEHTDDVFSLAYSPDGKWLASGGADNKIIIWDASTGKQIKILTGHTDTVFGLAFSPNGKILASGGRDMTLIFWDTQSFEMIGIPIKQHDDFIFSLAFSPDGKSLATADQSGVIYIWGTDLRKLLGEALRDHSDAVSSVAFSPDGKWLVSGGHDWNVILWDATTYQKIANIPMQNSEKVYGVVFNLDGNLLSTGTKEGTVALWYLQESFWIERACELAGRNFTQEEWAQYFPSEDYRQTCPQWPVGQ